MGSPDKKRYYSEEEEEAQFHKDLQGFVKQYADALKELQANEQKKKTLIGIINKPKNKEEEKDN